MQHGESLTIEAVEECVHALLPEGYPSVACTAEALHTSARTLQRRLRAAGVTYRDLVENVRFDKARRLIEESNASLQDIAVSLGYSEPSSLSRLFMRRTGTTPRDYRRTQRRAAGKL